MLSKAVLVSPGHAPRAVPMVSSIESHASSVFFLMVAFVPIWRSILPMPPIVASSILPRELDTLEFAPFHASSVSSAMDLFFSATLSLIFSNSSFAFLLADSLYFVTVSLMFVQKVDVLVAISPVDVLTESVAESVVVLSASIDSLQVSMVAVRVSCCFFDSSICKPRLL